MKKSFIIFLFVLVAGVGFCAMNFFAEGSAKVHKKEIFSSNYKIDKIMPSMTGPGEYQSVSLADSEKPELIWITGVKAEITDFDGRTLDAPEYLCHSHLRFDPSRDVKGKMHNSLFGDTSNLESKLFTLIQGKTEINLPEGFGIPLLSTESLVYYSMVVNNNDISKPVTVRVKTTFEYIKDKDLKKPLKPLFRTGASVQVPVNPLDQGHHHHHHHSSDGGHMDMAEGAEDKEEVFDAVVHSAHKIKETDDGSLESYHWYVEPGRHTYRKKIDAWFKRPFDTTIHYIAVHLHPYGQSVELYDLTAKKTVFKSAATNFKDKVGIKHLDHFSSQEGVPIYKDHEYEIIAVYDNPTEKRVDAMAVMYLFLHDKYFNKDKIRVRL